MEVDIATLAKAAFKKQYLNVPPTETFIFDDLSIELQEYVTGMFPPFQKGEAPIMAYFPNKGYFFLVTTKRFLLFERGRRTTLKLRQILDDVWYYPIEKEEQVGDGWHYISKFYFEYKSCFFFRKKLYVNIEHIGYYGMSRVLTTIVRQCKR